jgi:hypothetical protein
MQQHSLRIVIVATAMLGASAAMPQRAHATSYAYTQAASFGEVTETQLVESPFQKAGLGSDWSFTDSLLENRIEIAANASGQDKSPAPHDDGPGARVPEPATLSLAVAGLIGLTRSSRKRRPRSI